MDNQLELTTVHSETLSALKCRLLNVEQQLAKNLLPKVNLEQLKVLEANLNESLEQDEAMEQAVKEQIGPTSVQPPTISQPNASTPTLPFVLSIWSLVMVSDIAGRSSALTVHVPLCEQLAAGTKPGMYLLTDNTENSIKDFEKCVSLDPNFAIAVMQGHYAHYRQAVSQNSMSGINRVIEKFKRDLRKFPKCTEAYILLAQILMDQQQFDDADKYFQSAIDIDPANATLRVHRGHEGHGIEKADILAKKGAESIMLGPEPSCGVAFSNSKDLVKDWKKG
ncbi:Mitochondrial import receptor subunit TOM70 [Homalodisca vitripennis]|nr:Mitochondrial import receptor subunit TOM70 [Homalodisca vitripennis]